MMAVMTAQPPLPLTPRNARPVGAAAAIIEDDDGGRVFVHGNLAYAWDVGDTAGRRFAAVSLMRIKAATQLEVAEAFAVRPATVRRWDAQHCDAGVAGLLPERKGPKRKSKLTGTRSRPSVGCVRAERPTARSPPAPGCRRAVFATPSNPLAPTLTATSLASQPVPMIHLSRSRRPSRRSK
jgi:hypothetical protein